MRFSSDTGGTFTDLIVEHDDGEYRMYKSPTTVDDLWGPNVVSWVVRRHFGVR
jgi:N-methylhydantoinase A/oxoprolinase/acetone carboxylase beta subunit